MFRTIVVGTDGSETAGKAVAQAAELAAAVAATLLIVSAFEPVSGSRLREEASQAPDDVRWMVNPREDVDATLGVGGRGGRGAGRGVARPSRVRAIPPTRSSTSPRSRAPT